MAITVRHQRGQRRIIVSVSDALEAAAVHSLRRALVKALRTGNPILIDLTHATSIDRDGLTALVAAYRHAERTGMQLLLRTGPTQTRAVLAAFGNPPENRTPTVHASSGPGRPSSQHPAGGPLPRELPQEAVGMSDPCGSST